MIQGRLDLAAEPRVALDDGRTLPIDYDVLDRCGLSHDDRVRVELAGKRVGTVLPLRTTSEAIELLVGAGVLPPTTSTVDDHVDVWPRALLDIVFDHDTTDGMFSHDHHYLEPAQIERWARRSGLSPDDIDGEDTQPHFAINAKLAAKKSPYRWFALLSDDPRSAYIRVDRELADKLGLGLFER